MKSEAHVQLFLEDTYALCTGTNILPCVRVEATPIAYTLFAVQEAS